MLRRVVRMRSALDIVHVGPVARDLNAARQLPSLLSQDVGDLVAGLARMGTDVAYLYIYVFIGVTPLGRYLGNRHGEPSGPTTTTRGYKKSVEYTSWETFRYGSTRPLPSLVYPFSLPSARHAAVLRLFSVW